MIDDLSQRFTDRSLPKSEWTHAAHLAIGLWHIQKFGPAEALIRLRTCIRLLNEAHGTANTSTSGYHETITRAYVELLSQFLNDYPAQKLLDAILNDLLASSLADRNALLAFYSRDYLLSPAARFAWAEPDLSPLNLTRPFSLPS